MLSSIYLSGGSIDQQELASQGLPGADWRSVALGKLQRHGLRVVNPLEFAWSGIEHSEAIDIIDDRVDMRVRRSLDLIDQCDALLANLNRSNYGTAMELFYAHRRGKMVTVVGQSPFSPWVLSHSRARFVDIDEALDYLIEEHPGFMPLTWALQHEAQQSERYEQFPPAGEPDYKFIGGDMPVLVLAPHATAFWHEGEFYEAEAFTGSMAAVINRMSGAHAMYTQFCCAADPCWYLETPFRRAFADIVKAGQIGLVVILLGSSWHEAPGLHVWSCGPSSQVSDDYARRLKLVLGELEPVALDSGEVQVHPLIAFAAQELGVPSIVIKLHKRYRMPRLQPENFSRLIKLLSEYIWQNGLELARKRS